MTDPTTPTVHRSSTSRAGSPALCGRKGDEWDVGDHPSVGCGSVRRVTGVLTTVLNTLVE